MKIFVDMDGTVAKFYHHKKCLEKMYEKNYFRNLKPYALCKTINELAGIMPNSIFILSACINDNFCVQEKEEWIKQYMPNIQEENMIFVGMGVSKREAATNFLIETRYPYGNIKESILLLDDYSHNIYDWEKGGKNFIGVKFVNGFNNKSGNQYNYLVKNGNQFIKIIEKFILEEKI